MILFVTGIDTGVGKTLATGHLAAAFASTGRRVITQKLVQTGCDGASEDILEHRRIMQCGLLPDDQAGLTCPYCFSFPASPHLAAAREGRRIDVDTIIQAADTLAQRHDILLIEGAGGLCVPLNEETTILDLLTRQRWPTVLVSTPRLGSINHTLLSLDALRVRDIPIAGILYNLHPGNHPEIVADTRRVIRRALLAINPAASLVDLPCCTPNTAPPRLNAECWLQTPVRFQQR